MFLVWKTKANANV